MSLSDKNWNKRRSHLVGSECDVRGLQQTSSKHVAEGVVFFAEGEDGS